MLPVLLEARNGGHQPPDRGVGQTRWRCPRRHRHPRPLPAPRRNHPDDRQELQAKGPGGQGRRCQKSANRWIGSQRAVHRRLAAARGLPIFSDCVDPVNSPRPNAAHVPRKIVCWCVLAALHFSSPEPPISNSDCDDIISMRLCCGCVTDRLVIAEIQYVDPTRIGRDAGSVVLFDPLHNLLV